MFFGAVPTDCIEQVFKIMDIERWTNAYVCCSGSFRLERALSATYPSLGIHSNDVSVYSAVLGGLATGKPIEVSFRERLAFVQELVEGKTDIERAAAVLVACEMSRYARGKNEFATRHFRHYELAFGQFMAGLVNRLQKTLETLHVTSYFSGDWRQHADTAIKAGAGILAFPPFFKGDYEAQFRFIEENIAWSPPTYDLYDPSHLREIVRGFQERDATFCVLSDQEWHDFDPVLKFEPFRKVPHFCYASTSRSSYRRPMRQGTQFRYTAIDPAKLTADSIVEIKHAHNSQLNFIKDVYLAKSITHSNGRGNYLVYIDGMLVGAIIYDESPILRKAYGKRAIMLLSDVTVTGRARLSKLVAMLATSRCLLRPLEAKQVKKYDRLVTVVRSQHPSSMKYRDIYTKISGRWDDKEHGYVMIYGAPLTDATPQEIYKLWWNKHGRKAVDRDQAAAA